jgi:hypothetical protein
MQDGHGYLQGEGSDKVAAPLLKENGWPSLQMANVWLDETALPAGDGCRLSAFLTG